MSDDYCDLCDLPKSTCVHGMPPAPVPAPAPPKAPRVRAVRTPKAAAPAVPTRRAPRKWTPPEDFVPHIVEVLQTSGGSLDTEDVFTALEARLVEDLLDGDRQLTPEGELRWRYAARRARQAMIKDGVMTKGEPGIWSLAD